MTGISLRKGIEHIGKTIWRQWKDEVLQRESGASEETNPNLQICEKINICCLNHPFCGICYSSPSTNKLIKYT